MSAGTPVDVRHDEGEHRFVAHVEGRLARLDYVRDGDVLRLCHTEVPPALEGRGIAAAMVRSALAYAEANHLRVRPACSYVRAYMLRHPESKRLLPDGVSL